MESIFILYGRGLLHEDELEKFLEDSEEFIPEDDETETLGIFQNKEDAITKGNTFQFLTVFIEEWKFGDEDSCNTWIKDLEEEEWCQVVFDHVAVELDSKHSPKDKSLMN